MVSKNKRKNKPKKPAVLNRKQLRKEKRKQKKINRNEYYTNRNKQNKPKHGDQQTSNPPGFQKKKNDPKKPELEIAERMGKTTKVISTEEHRIKEKKIQKNVEKEMQKQRKEQLLQANIHEDKNIKRLEKQLKLHKRKTKSIPKSFTIDGLDYLLEVCDSDNMKNAVATEKEFNDVNDEFDEDFALMTGEPSITKKGKEKNKEKEKSDSEDSEDGIEEFSSEEDFQSEHESEESKTKSEKDTGSDLEDGSENSNISEEDINDGNEDEELTDSSLETEKIMKKKPEKRKPDNNEDFQIKSKKNRNNSISEDDNEIPESEADNSNEDISEFEDSNDVKLENSTIKGAVKINPDGTWEDIYGRLRNADGSIISKSEKKYIPPAVRAKMEASIPHDKKKQESLNRLKKQLKGLLNRLAEGNMHNIATQIENLYMNNSRNDMNDTLTSLILESVISNVITPERLLMEHILLVTILHANVGTEIGAHFLQTAVKKFDELFKSRQEVEDKSLDNVVNILGQLYNFRLFDSKLLYEILERLSNSFQEKDVECILHILRSVGFSLRKDDPIALKNLILKLQEQAASASDEIRDNARIKFMLDILLAIKNNNVTKIPNYDTSYSEHLKKIMKGFIRKGNYVTQLNISLDDLFKAEERGRWWVVGSAWTGNSENRNEETKNELKTDQYSTKLLDLARKQRMNTDTRRSIFCILMTAEDYLDAFEKLLKLGLKNQQDREIINVILHCCLQERKYNPYYAVLAQKFCDYDRKYQMTIKYSVWDKLKALNEQSALQISNLAKLLTHLFIEKGLPISTLKIVQFTELEKITLRFIRQILIGVLLHKEAEAVEEVFIKVALSDKLKMFRESLRLFIHHFLLRNLNSENIPEDKKDMLEERARLVETVLTTKERRVRL